MSNGPVVIGRVVHYRAYGTPGGEYPAKCRAADITDVDCYQGSRTEVPFLGHVSLFVKNPDGVFLNRVVLQDDSPQDAPHKGGTWHWPSECRDHA